MNKYVEEAIENSKSPKSFETFAKIIDGVLKGLKRNYTLQETADRFNALGIKTVTGKRFTANNVHRIIHILAYEKRSYFTAAFQLMDRLGRIDKEDLINLEARKA
jgi:hypothetical protein